MFKISLTSLLLLPCMLFSNPLDNLLQEYNTTTEKSLKTVDEKLGHVFIYSQKDIKLMQYHNLSDILKELPLLNLNKNRFGSSSLSLAGSKTTVSGFFRFFINDHEISSIYDQSPSLVWGDLPLDFIDHIEIYYGESSFSVGNETGIYFIRLYTKTASKENGSELNLINTSKHTNSQSFTDSKSLENGWSYLLYLNNKNIKDSNSYKANNYQNNEDRRYVYLDISNEDTNINMGYTDVEKDNYMGYSLDTTPDAGQIDSSSYFIDVTKYFLEDKSLKTKFSVDVNNIKYSELNSSAMLLPPVLNLSNVGLSRPKSFNEDLKFTKTNAYISKSFNYKDNNFLAAFNVSNKKYEVKSREAINLANQSLDTNYNDFKEEQITSFIFQDDYKVYDDLYLVANAKFDKYKRDGFLDDVSEELYRVGMIFTPFENFGIKSFYTKTYLPASFYNVDFADKNNEKIKNQKYKFYTVEGVYTTEKSKFGITYHNVNIDDFIYLTPIGFQNISHPIKTNGLIYSYEYLFENKNKLQLNYYTTKLSEVLNNSNKGGFIKYTGEYDNFEYFTSLVYKNGYSYKELSVRDSYDFSFGGAYNVTKNLKFSLKAENIFDKGSKSLYTESFPETYFPLDDSGRSVSFSMKWVF